jgi:DNA-binding CsgD family transcriptional regulator
VWPMEGSTRSARPGDNADGCAAASRVRVARRVVPGRSNARVCPNLDAVSFAVEPASVPLHLSCKTAARVTAGVGLTRREREILSWVERGKTNAEIAQILWISSGTVRKHLENAYEKLGVRTGTAAVARAGSS